MGQAPIQAKSYLLWIKDARKIASLVVIPLGIAIVQLHSIPYWFTIVGFHTGYLVWDWFPAIVWSLTLEVISIWRWLTRDKARIFAYFLTVLVISGPLAKVCIPLLKAYSTGKVTFEEVDAQRQEVTYYKDLIDSGRRGYKDSLDAEKVKLDRMEANYKSGASLGFEFYVQGVLTALSLIIFTIAIVISLDQIALEVDGPRIARDKVADAIQEGKSLKQISDQSGIAFHILQGILMGQNMHPSIIADVIRRVK